MRSPHSPIGVRRAQGVWSRPTGVAPSARRASAKLAVVKRWIRHRFGEPPFVDLGLPGGEFVDRGLENLAYGRTTRESLGVSRAPRDSAGRAFP